MIKNITVAIKEPANSKIIAISFISKKKQTYRQKTENDFYNCYTNVLPGLFIYFLCAFSINCAFKLHFIPHSFSQPETMLILWLAATAFFCE